MEYSELTSKLGVMQGRLLEQTSTGYQAFPGKNWIDEFELAADRQIGHIEWVLDSKDIWENPVLSDADQIRKVSENSGVQVRSLCANFVMQSWKEESPFDLSLLRRLVESLGEIGITHLVLPFVDEASMRTGIATDSEVRALLDTILNMSDASSLNLCVESDLAPRELLRFISNYGENRVGICYDIGNSASIGYSWREEFEFYWDYINLIHVKDRKLDGVSVSLGSGDAELIEVLTQAFENGFDDPITLEIFRNQEIKGGFDSQLRWLTDSLASK